jgi:hypothetical protein
MDGRYVKADLEAVARAYGSLREAGGSDLAARRAADAAYRRRHPGTPDNMETRRVVGLLIKAASDRGMLWPVEGSRPE